MNYKEAVNLAKEWTKGQDPDNDGWRSVILLLYRRVLILESLTQIQEEKLQALKEELELLTNGSDSQTCRK